MPQPVLGRFAPSPSGRMHLGNLFASLLAWLSVRSQGGKMLLRIENLDPLRTTQEFADLIMQDFEWLGLDWEYGPGDTTGAEYYQGKRTAFYEQCLQTLQAKSLVYPCFCSRAELHAAEAPHASDGNYLYNRRCLRLSESEKAALAAKRGAALRLKVPDETIHFTDKLQGPQCENLAAQSGDFIIRRSDGVFGYALAAPADDGAMGITEVARGSDLLGVTARQIWLLRELGYAPPAYLHLPLLLAPDGRRLAKRDKDMDAGELRARCKTPEPLLGHLAHLAGLLPKPEPIKAAELIPLFSLNKIPKKDIFINSNFLDF